jgi:hypothetical protein
MNRVRRVVCMEAVDVSEDGAGRMSGIRVGQIVPRTASCCTIHFGHARVNIGQCSDAARPVY